MQLGRAPGEVERRADQPALALAFAARREQEFLDQLVVAEIEAVAAAACPVPAAHAVREGAAIMGDVDRAAALATGAAPVARGEFGLDAGGDKFGAADGTEHDLGQD